MQPQQVSPQNSGHAATEELKELLNTFKTTDKQIIYESLGKLVGICEKFPDLQEQVVKYGAMNRFQNCIQACSDDELQCTILDLTSRLISYSEPNSRKIVSSVFLPDIIRLSDLSRYPQVAWGCISAITSSKWENSLTLFKKGFGPAMSTTIRFLSSKLTQIPSTQTSRAHSTLGNLTDTFILVTSSILKLWTLPDARPFHKTCFADLIPFMTIDSLDCIVRLFQILHLTVAANPNDPFFSEAQVPFVPVADGTLKLISIADATVVLVKEELTAMETAFDETHSDVSESAISEFTTRIGQKNNALETLFSFLLLLRAEKAEKEQTDPDIQPLRWIGVQLESQLDKPRSPFQSLNLEALLTSSRYLIAQSKPSKTSPFTLFFPDSEDSVGHFLSTMERALQLSSQSVSFHVVHLVRNLSQSVSRHRLDILNSSLLLTLSATVQPQSVPITECEFHTSLLDMLDNLVWLMTIPGRQELALFAADREANTESLIAERVLGCFQPYLQTAIDFIPRLDSLPSVEL
ncbi:hypothetical protein BLNAU_11188 [Blattamonas nauphoetae]|uniref:Uncharacterized protein n=1 Tax=Blattamonas nauphoetae TaxID=2049346 RepID=A0ABQ9XR89_9EUKA|nr:hypothetical protein BLNAU_11188 [Blattamonas nauphoetae]